jgi:hypothetical protein
VLRDNALKHSLSTGFEQGGTVTIKFFAELDATFSFGSYQILQRRSTLRQSLLSEVFAVEMQEIEGIEDDAVGSDSYGRLKRLKIRTAIAILDDSLTINDCRFAAETGSGTDDRGIAVAPIMSIPAKDTHLAALNHHLRAVAIVFDFVNLVLALWRFFNRGSKLWFDEP